MRRFLREASIPLIIMASYAGARLFESEPARVAPDHGTVTETTEPVPDAPVLSEPPTTGPNEPVLTDANEPVSEQNHLSEPETNEPHTSVTYQRSDELIVEPLALLHDARTHTEPARTEERATLEPQHEPTAYEYDEWRTSTIARMHVLEPKIERIAERFGTEPAIVYATLIVESSLDPLARNDTEDKYGLAQIRPRLLDLLVARNPNDSSVSLFDPVDNLDLYSAALSWIEHETGLREFTSLSAVHSRTGPLVSLDAFLASHEYAWYRSLVEQRVPYARSLIDACRSPEDPDLEAICAIEGNVTQRYARLVEVSIERSESTSGTRAATHYANAILALRAREESNSRIDERTRDRLERFTSFASFEARSYVADAATQLDEPLGRRYLLNE